MGIVDEIVWAFEKDNPEKQQRQARTRWRRKPVLPASITTFQPGDRVMSSRYGAGTVIDTRLSTDDGRSAELVEIKMDDGALKHLDIEYANLEKI
jgi:hypothetical protein